MNLQRHRLLRATSRHRDVSLLTKLASRVRSFEFCTIRTIDGVHWSDLVSNELLLRPASRTSFAPLLRALFAGLVMPPTDDLMITLPEWSIISTCNPQTGDNFAVEHAADGRISLVWISIRLIWRWMTWGRNSCRDNVKLKSYFEPIFANSLFKFSHSL